jgi:rhodanese-related sulfurtransferase
MKPELVSFAEASKYIYHSGTLLVDLRSREAYESGHVSGAWNIPFDEWQDHIDELMNYDRVIFYCAGGNHSLQAARELSKRGKRASSIAGGYEQIRQ